jgi:hypothetical protein
LPESENLIERIKSQIRERRVKFTLHAQQEMVEDDVTVSDLVEAVLSSTVLENYQDHRRGPCCLTCGRTDAGRFLHVVATTSLPDLVIITVYEPKPPKWRTPFQRGGEQ